MPRLSPRSPKRNHVQSQLRYRKRLKTRKVFDGCNRDNHDVIMFDKSDIDAIDDQSKTWPGYVEPKLSGLERFGYKSTLAKPTKLQFNCEETVTEENIDDVFRNETSGSSNDVFDNEVTESESSHESDTKSDSESDNDSIMENDKRRIERLCESVSRSIPLQKSLDYLASRTCLSSDDISEGYHKACVCLICDRFIKGTQKYIFVKSATILKNQHVLSVDYFNKSSNCSIPETLSKQYQVQEESLQHLLLSPRARRKKNSYMCCQSCATALRKKLDKAPKFAIANGFAIGYIPTEIVEEISDILAAMVAKIRFFPYVFNFYGGAHKAIKGNHIFLLMILNILVLHFNLLVKMQGIQCIQ